MRESWEKSRNCRIAHFLERNRERKRELGRTLLKLGKISHIDLRNYSLKEINFVLITL